MDSKEYDGSRFTLLIPFTLEDDWSASQSRQATPPPSSPDALTGTSVIDSLVEALSSNHMGGSTPGAKIPSPGGLAPKALIPHFPPQGGKFEVVDSRFPVRSVRVNDVDVDLGLPTVVPTDPSVLASSQSTSSSSNLRVLIVEVGF